MWNGVADSKKAKRLNKEGEERREHEKASEIIKGYEDIIKTKRKVL